VSADPPAGYDDPGLCAATLLCDRHPPDRVAFTFVEPDLSSTDVTFGELREASARCAAALAGLGVGPGDRVGVLMGKSADLVTTLLGIWRRGAVHVPLFTAFSRPAVSLRLDAARAKVVVVDADQYAKVSPDDASVVGGGALVVVAGAAPAGVPALADLLAAADPASPDARAVAVGPEGVFLLVFTSGTTGTPKGVTVALKALAGNEVYMTYGLDVRPDDVYWNAADPGWAYGLFYAVVGSMLLGVRGIVLRAGFSAALTGRVLAEFGVTNLAAGPTAYRALRAERESLPPGIALRCASAAGEPLTAEVAAWSEKALGARIRDHYGQTELGMTIVEGWHPDFARPEGIQGAGLPMPGWTLRVLALDSETEAPTGTLGRVAVDIPASECMYFDGYWEDPGRSEERFSADGRWYFTGDAGTAYPDGSLTVSARDDDVITMAGYRIGPIEIENVLALHESVAESAVIGAPDELRGEVLEAFVVLRAGFAGGDELTAELQRLVKTQYAAHAYPRAVHYVESLPKTPSGKVRRTVLRAERAAASG
jgi:acetyl-CoA synthetase